MSTEIKTEEVKKPFCSLMDLVKSLDSNTESRKNKIIGFTCLAVIEHVVLCGEDYPMMSDISIITGMSTAGMTGIIDSLEKRKLIERVNDKTDRRKNLIKVTEDGLDFYNKAKKIIS